MIFDKYLKVGQHPLKPMKRTEEGDDNQVCGCCYSDSPLYSKLWPLLFLISALTDYPLPLPKDKKPGQHRDWGYLPIMMVIGFTAFIYYGYLSSITLVLLRQLDRKAQAIGYLVPFHFFFLFFMISYARIVSQKPGQPKTIEKPDSILGEPIWCQSCQNWKPDRTHHCKVCNACVLRMDHHCPWVNGCVGLYNYRFYIQFLCHVSLLAIWIFSTSIAVFIEFHGLSTFNRIALAVIILTGIITLLIGPFTLSHIWLVLLNRTTIENSKLQSWSKTKDKERCIQVFTTSGQNVFNQGYYKNWTEIMGTRVYLWFLPLRSKEEKDGIHYGYNDVILQEYRNERSKLPS